MVIANNPLKQMTDGLRASLKEKDVPQIQVTYDYSIFKKHALNREVHLDWKHLENLKKSVEEVDTLFAKPIEVNEKMEVIDGQHRLEVCKQLKKPVYYIVSDKFTARSMLLQNVNQQGWDIKTYLDHFVKSGNENYIMFKGFIDEHSLKIVEGLVALHEGKKKGISARFREGSFIFPEASEVQKVEDKLKKYWKVIDLITQKSVKDPAYLKNSHFKTALMHFVSHKLVSMDTFLARLEMKLETIRAATSQLAYISQFVSIYNYHNKEKLDLGQIVDGEIKEELVQQYMFT